jgi:hypothetical protein
MARRNQHHAPTSSLLVIFGIAYIGLLLLFAWQTWEFVNWLFPDDELTFRVLTFVCFDVMAFLWACCDLFFRFTDPTSRTIVRWGWGITFTLSLAASILFLSIQGFFRFHLQISADMLNMGYSVSIIALVFNILILTAFLYKEITAIAQATANHKAYVRRKTHSVTTQALPGVTLSNVTALPQTTQNSAQGNAHTPQPLTRAQIQRNYRQRQAAQNRNNKGFIA